MIPIVIVFISLILDGITTNYLPYLVNNLSPLTPLLTITSLVIIYPFYKKKIKKYYALAIMLGLLYDLMYTNLFLTNAAIFLILSIIINDIYKSFNINGFRIILYVAFIICTYEVILATTLIVFNIVPITVQSLLYKIANSLVLNLMYGQLLYNIIRLIPKKYTNLKIN